MFPGQRKRRQGGKDRQGPLPQHSRKGRNLGCTRGPGQQLTIGTARKLARDTEPNRPCHSSCSLNNFGHNTYHIFDQQTDRSSTFSTTATYFHFSNPPPWLLYGHRPASYQGGNFTRSTKQRTDTDTRTLRTNAPATGGNVRNLWQQQSNDKLRKLWEVPDRKRILLSVFDGIGTAMLILSLLRVPIAAYISWETDRACKELLQQQWPIIHQRGDFSEDDIASILDLLDQIDPPERPR